MRVREKEEQKREEIERGDIQRYREKHTDRQTEGQRQIGRAHNKYEKNTSKMVTANQQT